MVWNFWPTGILSQSLTVRLVLNYARACHGMTILNTSRTVGRGQFLGLSRKFQDSWRVWGYIHWTFCYRVANCCSYNSGSHKGSYVRSPNVAVPLLQSAITDALLYRAEITGYISFPYLWKSTKQTFSNSSVLAMDSNRWADGTNTEQLWQEQYIHWFTVRNL